MAPQAWGRRQEAQKVRSGTCVRPQEQCPAANGSLVRTSWTAGIPGVEQNGRTGSPRSRGTTEATLKGVDKQPFRGVELSGTTEHTSGKHLAGHGSSFPPCCTTPQPSVDLVPCLRLWNELMIPRSRGSYLAAEPETSRAGRSPWARPPPATAAGARACDRARPARRHPPAR